MNPSTETQATSLSSHQDNKYLTFSLDAVEYGIPIMKVREIISATAITPLPNSSPSLKGIINLRGTVIPIIDLRIRFGLAEISPTETTCIVILEKMINDQKMVLTGVLVDSVSRVANINNSNIGNYSSNQINQDYIIGIAKDEDGNNKILLDIEKLLREQENCLAKAARA